MQQCCWRPHQVVEQPEYHRVEVIGPRAHLGRLHRQLAPAHQVLQIADEFADVTWQQIDIEATQPWRVYTNLAELRDDWESATYFHSGQALWNSDS